MFKHFAQNTCERYGAIICRVWFVIFFKNGGDICFFPYARKLSGVKWLLKEHLQHVACFAWRVCRTMGLNWSRPAALWGFSHLSSFSIPFLKICIWGIWLYGLGWNGRLHPWLFSSLSFLWAKEPKRSWDLGLKTDWNCLFRAFDYSQLSERVLPSSLNGATPIESCFVSI